MSSYNNVRNCYESTITCQHSVSKDIWAKYIHAWIYIWQISLGIHKHQSRQQHNRISKALMDRFLFLPFSSIQHHQQNRLSHLQPPPDLAFLFVKLFYFQMLPHSQLSLCSWTTQPKEKQIKIWAAVEKINISEKWSDTIPIQVILHCIRQ